MGTAQAGDRTAEHQHRQAQRDQVLADRVGDHIVVPHGAQRPAVRRFGDPPNKEVRERRQHDRRDRVAPLVAHGLWIEPVAQWRGDQRQTGRTIEQWSVIGHQ